ncbi:MAG: efflux RND transporter periplasmic adaptor subunit [Nitrospiraceae bacterium]|nr:efflux RND transporter periplasmic adaptor subunit [Nitrospiraceae bacterium]
MISKQNVFLLAAALLLSCGGHSKNAGEIGARIHLQAEKTAYQIPVQVVLPTQGALQEKITIYGKLAPVRETLLSSQFAGRISLLPFSEGDAVTAGQVVATLISPKAEALGQVAPHSKGKEMLPISIRAPFSGTILKKFHFAGDVLSPGEPLVKIQDTSRFFLWGQLPAVYLSDVKPGQELLVSFPDLPEQSFRTKIEKVNAAVDPRSQMARIRATLKNRNRLLKENLFATIQIVTRSVENGLLLQRRAVLHDAQGNFVFLKKNSQARRQSVKIGLKTLDTLEIRAGLAKTDSVILTGNYELKEGMSVRSKGN